MPSKNEETEQFYENLKKDGNEFYEKVKQYPLISLCFIIAVLFLIVIPYLQVDYQGISNSTVKATLENQYRATLAQILGGAAIGISLYYTWRRIAIAEEDLKTTQENLKVTQEGQITERFTRAIDQLGKKKAEIKMGGIYALGRIANESIEDHWPIMEILTTYIKMNSSIDYKPYGVPNVTPEDLKDCGLKCSDISDIKEISSDIQAIINVIGKRKYTYKNGESKRLNLVCTVLNKANFRGGHFEGVNFSYSHLKCAYLEKTHFEKARFIRAHLQTAILANAHLEEAELNAAHLEGAFLFGAHLEGAKLSGAHLERVHFEGAHLEGAHLESSFLNNAIFQDANLEGAHIKRASFMKANHKGAHFKGAIIDGVVYEKDDL